MTREYTWAENGRVSLVAEIDLGTGPGKHPGWRRLGVWHQQWPIDAASKAWAGLLEGFDAARDRYLAPWRGIG